MKTKLGINIDHIATLREARREGIPDLSAAAKAVKNAGADGITIHLREDRRHIQDADLYSLRTLDILPINLEMAVSDEIIAIALDVKPSSCCIVPEKREELTTEGGLDVSSNIENVAKAVSILQEQGIEVSLFIDPDVLQVEASKKTGADAIEIHTGSYANAFKTGDYTDDFAKIKEAAAAGIKSGLKVNAGHGLDYDNILNISELDCFQEYNIGYSVICHAVFVGLEEAVRQMKVLLT